MPERNSDDNKNEPQKRERRRPAEVTNVEGSNIPTYYANNIASVLTLWDARLEFGLIQSATREGMEVQPLARVMLSPPHMKAAAALLARLVREYERQYGPIALPEGAIPDDNEDEEEDGDGDGD